MGIALSTGEVSAEAIGEAVARLLASEEFGKSKRLRRFLQYIVEKTLAQELNAVKEYDIALAVFDCQPAFDPATDTIVRVAARRLRNALAAYYRGAGQLDPVVIEIPKGGYVPLVRHRQDERPGAASLRSGPFSTRRIWLWSAGMAFAAALLGLILWRAAIASGYGVPKAWGLYGSTLRVVDVHNRICWEKYFGSFDPSFPPLVIDKALIADLDGDGRQEVLFNYLPANAGLTGGLLFCYEPNGALRWQFHYGAAKTFGSRSFDATYRGRLIRPVKVGGKPLLLTVANHYLWYPSQVVLLDPRTGRVLEEYWHPGFISDCVLHDIDGDGEEEAVFSAINNPGDGLGHAAVGVLALPFSKVPRRIAAPGDPLAPVTGGGELEYALLPLPDVNRVVGLLPIPANLKIDHGRITVEMPLPEQGGIVYGLDFNLKVLEYRFSDNFVALHQRMAVQHLLDHSLTAEETESLGKVVRFPAAPDGNNPQLQRFWK
ncbi:MAG: hypothetical protein ABSC05_01985 [Candidatus Solibacter sp.]